MKQSMKQRMIMILGIITIIQFPAFSQRKIKNDIDSFVKEALAKIPEVPGLTVTVVKDGKPFFVEAYGYADREKGLKSTTSTPFYIASTTKSFMGMATVILAEEGKIDLFVPLSTYKPFSGLKNKAVWDDITITDLLNHTSGISNGYLTYRDAYTGDKPIDVKVMLLEETTSKRGEGKTYQYDNLGYNILDILLELELGIDWRDLLDEKIFTPLNMKHTSAYISEAEKNNWGLAMPYMSTVEGESPRAYLMKDDGMMQAAGGLITSADDVANWLLFNLNDGKLKGKQVYPSSWVQQTHKKISSHEEKGQIFNDNGYGLGWNTANFKSEDVIYHFGGYTGFFSHISFMPEQKIGVAVFANESYVGDNISNLIATYIYDLLIGQVTEEGYEEGIDAVRNVVTRVHEAIAKDTKNREGRKWQLDLPMESYEGEYFNKLFGTIKVKVKDGAPEVSLGSLHCIATPFVESSRNAMRVALIPMRGGGLNFKLKDGKVYAANYQGQNFARVK